MVMFYHINIEYFVEPFCSLSHKDVVTLDVTFIIKLILHNFIYFLFNRIWHSHSRICFSRMWDPENICLGNVVYGYCTPCKYLVTRASAGSRTSPNVAMYGYLGLYVTSGTLNTTCHKRYSSSMTLCKCVSKSIEIKNKVWKDIFTWKMKQKWYFQHLHDGCKSIYLAVYFMRG